MSISDGKVIYGLTATGTNTRQNVSGSPVIGAVQAAKPLTGSDIASSFSITSTGVGNVATLTLASGAVAQTTGTPTINDAGVDFQGETLATSVSHQSILLSVPATNTGIVTVESGDHKTKFASGAEGVCLNYAPSITGLATTMTMTFAASGDQLDVTLISKTS